MTTGRVLVATHQGTWVVKMVGDVRMTLCNAIEYCLQKMFDDANFSAVIVDLTETEGIDSTSLGLLAKLSINTKNRIHNVPTIVSTNDDITRTLLSMGFNEKVFSIITESEEEITRLAEVPAQAISEETARRHVIEAHRTLMKLNDRNRNEFKDLVEELENTCKSD